MSSEILAWVEKLCRVGRGFFFNHFEIYILPYGESWQGIVCESHKEYQIFQKEASEETTKTWTILSTVTNYYSTFRVIVCRGTRESIDTGDCIEVKSATYSMDLVTKSRDAHHGSRKWWCCQLPTHQVDITSLLKYLSPLSQQGKEVISSFNIDRNSSSCMYLPEILRNTWLWTIRRCFCLAAVICRVEA